MILCKDCGFYGEPKSTQESRGEYWGRPAYESVHSCPNCGSDDFVEADYCTDCGEVKELKDGLCHECWHRSIDPESDCECPFCGVELRLVA